MSEFSSLLRSHRSIRRFRPDPIPDSIIEQVLGDALVGTSSSGNLNSISMVLTRDPERRRKMYELQAEQEMVLEAPLHIAFCVDWYRTREWLRRRNARDNFNNFFGYHVGLVDAALISQSVSLGFEAHGLGICYLGTTVSSMGAIADFLELPETCVPITSIVVGYPKEDPPKRDRLPLSAFVHDETYQIPTGEQIDAIYAEREEKGWARYMGNPRTKALAEEHGIQNLAEYYTSDLKYAPSEFIEISEEVQKTLEARGFWP